MRIMKVPSFGRVSLSYTREERMFHGNSCKLICTLFVMCSLGSSSAPKTEPAADLTGTWTWAMQRQNGGGREVTAKLKQQGEKITGTISGMGFGGETEITDGTFKDGVISFKVTRTRNGQDSVSTYSGKLQGDAIKGKAEIEMRGQKMMRNWEAQRVKEDAAKEN